MDVPNLVKTFLAWFPDRYKVASAVALIAAATLFLPSSLQQRMGTYEWSSEHRLIEWGVFSLFTFLLLFSGGEAVFKSVARTRRMSRRMKLLSAAELHFITGITTGNHNSAIAWPYEAGVVNLFAEGILARDPEMLANGQYAYALAPRARTHLRTMKVGNPR